MYKVKKLLAVLLTVVLCVSLFPMMTYASRDDAATYNVYFSRGGQSSVITGDDPAAFEAVEGQMLTLPENPYTHTDENYSFLYWRGNFGSSEFQPGEKVEMPAHNVTFSAVWGTPQSFTFTDNSDASIRGRAGTVTADVDKALYGQTVTLTVNAWKGYALKNLAVTWWYTTNVEYKKIDENTYTFEFPAVDDGTTNIKYSFVATGDAAELSSIAITTPPDKTAYLDGESFDKTGMELTATYADGSTREVSSFADFSPKTLTLGMDTVTITYTEGEITKTVDLPVTVSENSADLTIHSADEMFAFAESVNGGETYEGKKVELAADIDLAGREWTPVGDGTNLFRGSFDGNGKKITGFSITGTGELQRRIGSDLYYNYLGLFGHCGEDCIIRGLTLEGSIELTGTIATEAGKLYLLVHPFASDAKSIINCVNRVDLNIDYSAENESVELESVAGIGSSREEINSCRNYASIQNKVNGNACGIGRSAQITDCGNYGDIVAGHYGTTAGITVGGNVSISGCTNHGSMETEAYVVGGIAGDLSSGKIENCYNAGNISSSGPSMSAKENTACVCGLLYSGNSGVGITNSYNIGTLKSASGASVYDYTSAADKVTTTNCYKAGDTFTCEDLNAAVFKTDVNEINGGYPLLIWENGEKNEAEYAVRFQVDPSDADVAVYRDSSKTEPIMPVSGVYSLQMGTYYYVISHAGYQTEEDSFTINYSGKTMRVSLLPVAGITFNVSPASGRLDLADSSGNAVEPDSAQSGSYTYTLLRNRNYTYTATASGYNSTTREFNVAGDATIDVVLTKSSQGQVSEDRVIRPDNVPYTITEGGSYDLTAGDYDTGYVYIDTTEPVTIIGSGTAAESMSENLHIVGKTAGIDLTLQDVYISNNSGQGNMMDFQGKENTLNFIGTNLLDQDTGATGYAMIHVPDSAELTVTGGTLYMYKREQGAGIGGNGGATGGGQAAETNGTIHIRDAKIFAKNSKQGALIGAGAQAGSQKPGSIDIENSTLYLIAISRGAAIGGSAGGNGASSGSNVSVKDSQLTINVDFSGAAIGSGGYDAGNDSDGGTLVYDGGSIRTFIDYNAAVENLWPGVTEAGVNGNTAITAEVVNQEGTPLYLLELDTKDLEGDSFTIKEGDRVVYAGGLHQYAYLNEALYKDQQIPVNNTFDNWVPLDDPNLYLYLTGEDHTLDVNGQTVRAAWNKETKSFTVKMEGTDDPPEAADKSLLEEALKAAQNAQKDVRISEDGSDVDPADQWVPQSAADALTEAVGAAQAVMEDKEAAQEQVDQAVTALNNAVKVFEEAKEPGTKSHDVNCPSRDFEDLDTSKWYHEAIDYVLLKNYFNGVGDGKFEPDGTMTRAMFVTVLGRAAGVEEDKNAHSSFSDVADGKWYTAYVDWAAKNGIVNGYNSETFGTDDFVTREQMAVILYRYAKYRKVDTSGTDASKFNAFKDKDTVSGWAVEAMTWAAGCGLINGMGDGTLAPQETATRAQVAQIIMNYDKKIA